MNDSSDTRISLVADFVSRLDEVRNQARNLQEALENDAERDAEHAERRRQGAMKGAESNSDWKEHRKNLMNDALHETYSDEQLARRSQRQLAREFGERLKLKEMKDKWLATRANDGHSATARENRSERTLQTYVKELRDEGKLPPIRRDDLRAQSPLEFAHLGR